jgi:hyperosmotically inducible periplasmic protein
MRDAMPAAYTSSARVASTTEAPHAPSASKSIMRNHLTQLVRPLTRLLGATVIMTLLPVWGADAQQLIPREDRLSWNIYRELITLPHYGMFDHLSFETGPGGVVTLRGYVRRPIVKDDAEARVKQVEGVEEVRNEIEVLPPSPQDDRIRLAVYRAIYRHDTLERYGLSALPPIHIIVRNGHVTLEGVVDTKMDRQIAEMQARAVPGTFTITNNLQVEGAG